MNKYIDRCVEMIIITENFSSITVTITITKQNYFSFTITITQYTRYETTAKSRSRIVTMTYDGMLIVNVFLNLRIPIGIFV